MENLYIYEKVRAVPKEAKKPIAGGKLIGKTDINPMWRIKTLTELFGACGIGWKSEITKKEVIPAARGEVAAFVDINLYIKVGDTWSEAIAGTGGSMLVKTENKMLVSNDEAFKMAYTDALSVACKALGVGADVYWDKDSTKYDESPAENPDKSAPEKEPKTQVRCPKCDRVIVGANNRAGQFVSPAEILKKLGSCAVCYKKNES